MTTIFRQKYVLISSVQGRETVSARRIGFSGLANSNMLSAFFREQLMILLRQPNLGKKNKIAIIRS